ncbi:2-hydroxyglutaryl-CoA dehydratase, D-component [Treponema socranskii subsp. socranskii VPI DR56BR1116 = ATCC 35536]|uniref:2-hydroxyglutaryl-CoA dehydratase, D-component n=1 Tax=Treponema socranskii subsp. socranskii VPI DR56BR1116 = ATCC 35536 TaxID=1125725 RepID=U1FAV4_TRESO|nr:2-hydroxyacyl-CoA dehydratase [Treponema socranskii]ERF61282.1 2-hydroxyglutaryl-CoA dehydratase, D-component [Treponema socranskii subsp. socranskii VPI DR56BR1116 = ATCC 35536]
MAVTQSALHNELLPIRIGIDVGSTTVKIAVLDDDDTLIYSDYERHRADIRSTIISVVNKALDFLEKNIAGGAERAVTVKVTGSGGLSVSQWLSVPFIQEVIAATTAVKTIIPLTDVVIELGGEDAKITYFKGGVEQRMNGTCAGGTGAFIDQMAALLETDADGLNTLAKDAHTIYPIAARCGVFAKTDVQPLINEGARREDIAASIFQAVVNQTISGLACGKPIRGHVAFLGGPLHFMDQLRERFIVTLKLKDDEIIVPENSQLFVAQGCAYSADRRYSGMPDFIFPTVADFRSSLSNLVGAELSEVQRLEPLFKSQSDLDEFVSRHAKEKAKRGDLDSVKGPVFLGLDAGSTTTKAVLIDQEGRILWDFYAANAGNPVDLAVKVLKGLYARLPKDVYIARAVSTGYGEALFQAALNVDAGEVETITHFRAADFFVPGVEFLLDIGGQDMKCLRMKDGAIVSIQLNEACSSGCGSFLDNFARTMGMDVREFSKRALRAEKPVDLGSRCTVFMNSRVKQAQKEGASVADISAGLSYSVIKNALFKVIKLRKASDIGTKVVVQGGTFNNDAVLRAFENISGVHVFRPDVAGLMGAYGSALIAYDQWLDLSAPKPEEGPGAPRHEIRSGIATLSDLESFSVKLDLRRCGKCQNNCLLTINTFSTGGFERKFVTGNRCERGAELDGNVLDASNKKATNIEAGKEGKLPNMFAWKYARLFNNYIPLRAEDAPMGEVGIPRVLNMYENYPLWFTFFTALGFRVRLSSRSSRTVYEKGLETIPSESVCYPGKISHGHVESLLQQGVKFIFYPCAPYELQEDSTAGNHYNCPIVTSYPEVLRNNIDSLRQDASILYMDPFLPIYDKDRLAVRLAEELIPHFPELTKERISRAVDEAWKEEEKFRRDTEEKGIEAIEETIRRGANGIVLAGRPYHLDPEINHGIPELINDLGLAVFTEDSVAHLGSIERPLRIIDQWTYHNRLYRAASFVTGMPNIELVQLTSFGCGLDAVTADQVDEIMRAKGRMYTLIKIDEGANLGAVRIRIRSLIAAVKERERRHQKPVVKSASYRKQVFTKEMKYTHTIIAPQMSPIHFRLFQKAFEYSGYKFVVLDAVDPRAVDIGLRFVNNDACYPSILVTGQMIAALESGKYDLNHTSLIISQTGGGCRATNYIGFIRRALNDAGWGHIPVLSLNANGLEQNPGFKVTLPLLERLIMSSMIGDVLMRVLYRTRPYEKVQGSANALYEKWNGRAEIQLRSLSVRGFHKLVKNIIDDFDALPLLPIKKPRIGIVGEILVKFHPTANNQIVDTIEREGAEAVMPDMVNFFLYTFSTGIFRHEKLAFPKKTETIARLLVWFTERFRKPIEKYLRKSRRFDAPETIYEQMKSVDDIVQLGNITGEGWFLTAEMVELIKTGVPSIACVQPFACLPNHVTGKGMIKELRRRFPGANISAIDYDPGSSEVNQLNRLKLLLSNAPIGKHPDENEDGMIVMSDDSLVKPEIRFAEGAVSFTDFEPVAAGNRPPVLAPVHA